MSRTLGSHGPDDVLETVKVLLEFRANANLEMRPRLTRGTPITAGKCGANHSYDRVRALFFDYADHSLHNDSKHKPGPLQIGRTWMLPSLSDSSGTERDGPIFLMDRTNPERFCSSYHSTPTSAGDQRQPDTLDFSSFPYPDSTNQSHISRLTTHFSDGPWSPSNTDSLIAGFSVIDMTDTSQTSERSAQPSPFPQLNSHISKNPLETNAGKLWADLGKPKGHPVVEEVSSSSASNEKDSLPEIKRMKVRGRNRWQPLEF